MLTQLQNKSRNQLKIKTMLHLRKKLEELESETANVFSALLRLKPEFIFLTEDAIENGEFDEEFDYTNDITGNVIPVHVIKIDKYGIHTCDVDDETKRVVKLSDFSIGYQIRICELMAEAE